MTRPNWLLSFIKLTFPRKPEYGRFAKLPGVGRFLEKHFFEGDYLVTVPRNETIKIDQRVGEQEQMVLPTDLLDHFIDKMSYHVVMDFCICRRSMSCKDYPIEYGCIFMGEAARGINPEWGKHVTKEDAKAHIRRCEDAGLIHFVGKSKLDTQWLGIGPGEQLLTICNCCPCCCITRSLPYTPSYLNEKLVIAPGVTVSIGDECVGCGKCTDEKVCFVNAISMDGDKAVIGEDCRGCGRCVKTCKVGAIKITIDKDAFLNESIERIRQVVDVPH